LWSFNEESVARAIAASTIPVISGVGMKPISTIADFVAECVLQRLGGRRVVVQTRREFDKHVMDLRARLEGSLPPFAGTFAPRARSGRRAADFAARGSATATAQRADGLRRDWLWDCGRGSKIHASA